MTEKNQLTIGPCQLRDIHAYGEKWISATDMEINILKYEKLVLEQDHIKPDIKRNILEAINNVRSLTVNFKGERSMVI